MSSVEAGKSSSEEGFPHLFPAVWHAVETASWEAVGDGRELLSLETESGDMWSHLLLLPDSRSERAILEASGDFVEEADTRFLAEMAARSDMPVAGLFGLPNQPPEGEREDDLMAASLAAARDARCPGLFALVPMAAACIAAMQRLAEQGRSDIVLTGASKRGWTTWLAAACQPRHLAGIAPRSYEALNSAQQIKAGWRAEALHPYISRGIDPQALRGWVDPAAWLNQIQAPILSITGSEDEFWLPDSERHYWHQLPESAQRLVVPGGGHSLEPGDWCRALGDFARAC